MTRKKTIGNDAEPSRGCAQYIFHAVFLYRRHTNYDDALHIQTHAGESKKEIAERKDWFRNRRSEWRTTTRKTEKMCVVCVCCTLAIRRIQLDKKTISKNMVCDFAMCIALQNWCCSERSLSLSLSSYSSCCCCRFFSFIVIDIYFYFLAPSIHVPRFELLLFWVGISCGPSDCEAKRERSKKNITIWLHFVLHLHRL